MAAIYQLSDVIHTETSNSDYEGPMAQTTKKPRNYAATESTLLHLRKTRADVKALTALVRVLERTVKALAKRK